MSNSEEMMRAAILADRASDDITRQANSIESNVYALQKLFDPGYADNAAHLIRLLENAAQQQQNITTAAAGNEPQSFVVTLPFVHFGCNAAERAEKAPHLSTLLGMACFPFHQARQRGMLMKRAKYALRLDCNGELIDMIEQERDFHPQLNVDMALLRYHVEQFCMSEGFDSMEQAVEQLNTGAPLAGVTPRSAKAACHQLSYTLYITPLS